MVPFRGPARTGGDDRLYGYDESVRERTLQPPVVVVGDGGRLVDGPPDPVTLQLGEDGEASLADGGFDDAPDLVHGAARATDTARSKANTA